MTIDNQKAVLAGRAMALEQTLFQALTKLAELVGSEAAEKWLREIEPGIILSFKNGGIDNVPIEDEARGMGAVISGAESSFQSARHHLVTIRKASSS